MKHNNLINSKEYKSFTLPSPIGEGSGVRSFRMKRFIISLLVVVLSVVTANAQEEDFFYDEDDSFSAAPPGTPIGGTPVGDAVGLLSGLTLVYGVYLVCKNKRKTIDN